MTADIALVSGCDTVRYSSFVGHQLYARRHGHAYHLELAPFPEHRGYFHKVKALAEHIRDHDWVVWFDDDAFITDLDNPFVRDTLAKAEEQGCWMVIAPSCTDELNGAWAAYNTGVFALRNCPEALELLAVALSPPEFSVIRGWWDQDRLGVFTHGDQDVIAWHLEQEGRADGVLMVDPLTWNARPWSYGQSLQDHPVVHFPGHPDKTLSISDFARRMRVDTTLVQGTSWSPSMVAPVTRQVGSASSASLAARRLAAVARRGRRRVVRKVNWVRETGHWR